MKRLADIVSVERRFARSARIDADLNGTPPLTGYILQPSVRKALETMAMAIVESEQAAFTWTGPYGGGKSCAALLVGNLVGGRSKQRTLAREIVGAELVKSYADAFPGKRLWTVVPLTGRRASMRTELADAAGTTLDWSPELLAGARSDDRRLCEALKGAATDDNGVLVLIDELGKFFEHAALEGGDVHLLQDLAETASRSRGRLILIGVLHQSFAQYADRLPRAAKDEWAKIQGRFLDIPFAAGPDEVATLLARAIKGGLAPDATVEQAHRLAATIGQRRSVDEANLADTLACAWPLHPATALILGPVSRQRFAQNERSVFGFLTSAEPYAFQSFLNDTPADEAGAGYTPDRLWDYLIANFGLELTAGPNGTRVSVAVEAIERAAVRGPEHARLAKIAALIELFRNGSGLTVSDMVLAACAPDLSSAKLEAVLAELVDRAILIRQPRLGGYALFSGTDFDLDEALNQYRERLSETEIAHLPTQLGVGPVAAKRHYFERGALRTFEVVLQILDLGDTDMQSWVEQTALMHTRRPSAGHIVLLMPAAGMETATVESAAKLLTKTLSASGTVSGLGIANRTFLLREHVSEFFALKRVEEAHPQLEGDRIARRELAARRSHVTDAIRQEMLETIGSCRWWSGDSRLQALDGRPLAFIASEVADRAFPSAPILRSELLNRDRPSSSAMAAARVLGYAMVTRAEQPDLGFEGFPAELGLYLTVLQPFGLHREVEGIGWRFCDPSENSAGASLLPAWTELKDATTTTLGDLYSRWGRPPYGLKRGVMPIFALAYLLAHRDVVTVYVDGVYQALLDTVFVDRLFQGPDLVELHVITRTEQDVVFLERIAELLSDKEQVTTNPLVVASALFRRFRTLPEWTRRTATLSEYTRKIRDAVLKADDPESLLFDHIPSALEGVSDRIATITTAIRELEAAYPVMLDNLRSTLAERLAVNPTSFEDIGIRATTVAGVTADLRFDAFAMRVGEFGTGRGDIEGLASLLVHKPPQNWGDRELDLAQFELAKLCLRFREAEAMAELKGREPTAQAISVMVGIDPNVQPIRHAFHVNEREMGGAETLAEILLERLRHNGMPSNVEFAALARVFEHLLNIRDTEAGQ